MMQKEKLKRIGTVMIVLGIILAIFGFGLVVVYGVGARQTGIGMEGIKVILPLSAVLFIGIFLLALGINLRSKLNKM